MPHRFFVTPAALKDGVVHFTDAQAHQMRDVLRMRAGQEVLALDNLGTEYRVTLREISRSVVRGEIVERRAARGEPKTKIVLYQALVKADKFEWVLQKGTEIGVTEFVPMHTTRAMANNVSKQKYARWTQILTEAAEQAGRGKIPQLQALQSFGDALGQAQTRGGATYVLWENETALDLKRALEITNAEWFHVFVGPEGGFTEQEIALAQTFGAPSVGLGPRILRTETAGMVAISAILYARGDLSHT
jgi:16S rRNA (uracil1498-N3)-methyltransferase